MEIESQFFLIRFSSRDSCSSKGMEGRVHFQTSAWERGGTWILTTKTQRYEEKGYLVSKCLRGSFYVLSKPEPNRSLILIHS